MYRARAAMSRSAATCSWRRCAWACVCAVVALYGIFIVSVISRFAVRRYFPDSDAAGGAAGAGRPNAAVAEWELQSAAYQAPTFSEQTALQKAIDAAASVTIAWAIPVGGRTKRAESLRAMATNLLTHGVRGHDVLVFEDVLSRDDGAPDRGVAAVAAEFGLRVIHDYVDRSPPPGQTQAPFGLFLSRHYKFMLDYVFVPGARAAAFAALTPDRQALQQADPTPNKVYDFIVILEDDLTMASDLVSYFVSMSRVMAVDPTLYCACAHQDNAFLATSNDDAHLRRMQLTGFELRRGNHFMAPGWMTSGKVYREIVRSTWLNEKGNLIHGTKYIPNGHWDRFWDARIDEKECIFPANPRIVHMGADGFTVSRAGQLELYANIRLARAASPPTTDIKGNPVAALTNPASGADASTATITGGVGAVDYGDLWRLTARGYEFAVDAFLREATLVSVMEQLALYRNSRLVVIVDADDDRDIHWNHVLAFHFGVIGLGGYGGHNKYAKLRGVHRGAVFITWLTNTVLAVGTYSPYIQTIKAIGKRPATLPAPIQYSYEGCYSDRWERDLSHHIPWYSPRNISPARCALSCHILGYSAAGIQAGYECWCGDAFGKYGLASVAGAVPAVGAAPAAGVNDDGECQACPRLHRSNWWYTNAIDGVVDAVSRLLGGTDALFESDIPGACVNAYAARAAGDAAAAATAAAAGVTPPADAMAAPPPLTCGGSLKNSIYSITRLPKAQWPAPHPVPSSFTPTGVVRPALNPLTDALVTPFVLNALPPDLAYVKGAPGDSCDAACAATPTSASAAGRQAGGGTGGGGRMVCRDQFMPYLTANCPLLRAVMGCDSCANAPNPDLAYMAPYKLSDSRECVLTKASFLRCDVRPSQASLQRGCVCQFVPPAASPRIALSGKPRTGVAVK